MFVILETALQEVRSEIESAVRITISEIAPTFKQKVMTACDFCRSFAVRDGSM
jgi:hypothetical protein